MKRGLTFTLMVAGCSGIGKTTFVNTLCENPVLPPRNIPDAQNAAAEKTVTITPTTVGTLS
jgi:cell division control protein 11